MELFVEGHLVYNFPLLVEYIEPITYTNLTERLIYFNGINVYFTENGILMLKIMINRVCMTIEITTNASFIDHIMCSIFLSRHV